MKREVLGDSYDMVKRLWADLLRKAAPLYADPVFYNDRVLRQAFTQLTRIRMMDKKPPRAFSILLDPDKGIRLEGKSNRMHVTTTDVAEQLKKSGAKYVVVYDQSFPRCKEPARRERMQQKMKSLAKAECLSLYYVSHASFLFTARSRQDLQELKAILTEAGVPACKLEKLRTARDASRTSC